MGGAKECCGGAWCALADSARYPESVPATLEGTAGGYVRSVYQRLRRNEDNHTECVKKKKGANIQMELSHDIMCKIGTQYLENPLDVLWVFALFKRRYPSRTKFFPPFQARIEELLECEKQYFTAIKNSQGEDTRRLFQSLTYQTHHTIRAALKRNFAVLEDVIVQTPELCNYALSQNYLAIRYIREQTSDQCLQAICWHPNLFQFVHVQTLEICKIAISYNPILFRLIIHQTLEICTFAVQKDAMLLEFITQQTEELCLMAVKIKGLSLKHVQVQTPKICMAAVKSNPKALKHVQEQTEEMCCHAVKCDWRTLKYVHIQSEKICATAIQSCPKALQYVRDQTLSLCLQAISEQEDMIIHVRDLTLFKLVNESVTKRHSKAPNLHPFRAKEVVDGHAWFTNIPLPCFLSKQESNVYTGVNRYE